MGALTAIDFNRKRSTFIPITHINVVKASHETNSLGDHDPDVIQIMFDLVYEGVNSNGDRFTEAEIRQNYASLQNKPINWEHAEPNIGTITDAYLVEAAMQEPLKIQCKGVIWSWEYPEYADIIANSALISAVGLADAATYGMSMECYYHDWDFVIGEYEQVFDGKDNNDQFEPLRGKSYGGRIVSRELKGIIFGGSGVTESPAEKKARLLAVASNKKQSSKTSQLFEDLVDSDFAVPIARLLPLDKPEHVQASLKMFDSVIGELKGNEFKPAQIREAHMRLLYAADKYGISVDDHECSVCSHGGMLGAANDSAGDSLDTTEKEESEAKMDKTELLLEQATEVEETEALTEASDEAITDEVVEDEEVVTEVDADEVEEAPAEETEEAEAGEFSLQTALEHLEKLILSLREAPASTEVETVATDEEELDELAIANKRIETLETELATSQANLTGLSRLQELKSEGIKVDKKSEASKKEFLAGLSKDEFKTYLNDVATAAKTSDDNEEDDDDDVEEAIATLNMENEEVPDKRDWAAIFSTYKLAKN